MKRALSMLLVLLMLMASFTVLFTSCTDEKEEEKVTETEKGNNENIEAVEGDIFAERAAVDDELETVDYGGRKFRIVSHRTDEYWVEEDQRNKGNLISDAKYDRNKTVEDRFNVEIEVAYQAAYYDVNTWVSKTVLSGADEFDLFCSHSAYAGGVVVKNVFLNWYDIPHVNFDKPWWSEFNKTDLTYDGKCLLAISDFNYLAYSQGYCLFFNKNLAAAYDMGNLYEVVLNGDWTIDYFLDLIGNVYQDHDGDGDKSEGDIYGYYQPKSYQSTVSSWLYAFDNPATGFDEDGVPVITVKTDKINNIVSKTYDFLFNTAGVYYDNTKGAAPSSDMFFEKRAVFFEGVLSNAAGETLRNFDDEYGLLPLPKWDENQDRYYTTVSGEHTILAVPKTCKDTEFVGTITEALSAESYKQVVPTFYEIALKTRYLRDSESKEVLDLVMEGIVHEFGKYLDGKGFGGTLGYLMEVGNSNFESYYNKNYNTARVQLKKVIKTFDKLN